MFKIILTSFSIILCAFYFFSIPESCGKDPCSEILANLASGKQLSEEMLKRYGFSVSQVKNFDRAITKRMTVMEWFSSKPKVKTSMEGFEKSINNFAPPAGTKLPPPRATVTEIQGGYQIEGHRYIVRTVNGEKRIFKFQFRESISHDGQNIAHYASANVTEMAANGDSIKLIAYADSPHIDRIGAKWFHGHDGTSGAFLGEIPAKAYVHTALEDISRWARDLVGQTLSAAK